MGNINNIPKIKILVGDDHSFVRVGIQALLSDIDDMEIIAEAENGVEAVIKSKELNPDVVVLDSFMPFLSGADATGIIKKHNPEIGVIVIAVSDNEEYIFEALRNGASGVIYKNTSKEEFVKAIRAVFKGNKYIGENLAELIIENIKFRRQTDIKEESPIGYMLTKRERQILGGVAEGMSNSEIALKLGISPRTVDSHKTHLIRKLNLASSSALRKFAIENKFITNS